METVFSIFGQRIRLWQFLASLVMLALTASIGFTVRQSDFWPLIGQYSILFLLYWVSFQALPSKNELPFLMATAIALRVVLLFSYPLLSDDVYRFIWDGRLWVAGINPFLELPSHYLEAGNEVPGLNEDLFERLNSPNYFTVYPPVAQGIFAFSVWISPHNIWGSIFMMKLILFFFELGNLWLIPKLLQALKMPARNVLIYALNPLIFLETIGNLHFEGVMIFFLLLAIYALVKGQWVGAAVAWALSIASKLLPTMFLPFLLFRLNFRTLIGFGLLLGLSLFLVFGGVLPGKLYQNMGQSLDLYFQNFEFNGSLYYIVRTIGQWWIGYNPIKTIGPILAVTTLIGILLLAFSYRDKSWKSLPRQMLFAITIYLALSTTVHPWYTALPLVFCLFTQFRYPVLWTGLIYWTYINYSYNPYSENLYVVAIEYLLVFGFAVYEFRKILPQFSPREL